MAMRLLKTMKLLRRHRDRHALLKIKFNERPLSEPLKCPKLASLERVMGTVPAGSM